MERGAAHLHVNGAAYRVLSMTHLHAPDRPPSDSISAVGSLHAVAAEGAAAVRGRRADHTFVADHSALDADGVPAPDAEQHRQLRAVPRPHKGPLVAEWWQAEHGFLRTAVDVFAWPAHRRAREPGAAPPALHPEDVADLATAGLWPRELDATCAPAAISVEGAGLAGCGAAAGGGPARPRRRGRRGGRH